ncbi:MAG: 30S ribosomal protein S4 [Candidatus Aureabacteria bacterium]|nr:30S ribosomal protein S4 [Candidatus Auribacterota bacterium]
MGRYTEAKCRLCRADGEKLFLKGKKCYTAKCMLERRKTTPGDHGKMRRKFSEYKVQLREKQKLRRIYGIFEKQFRNYFAKASLKKGITGDNLISLLEKRLDNVVFRSGFTTSRAAAREFVNHGHIKVNGRKVDIVSFQVKNGDVVTLKDSDKSRAFVKDNLEYTSSREIPSWLAVDPTKQSINIVREMEKEDLQVSVNVQLVVELYSK